MKIPDKYKMSWWRLHLNWTWIIFQLITGFAIEIIIYSLYGYLDKVWFIPIAIGFSAAIYLDIWYLKQKSRSLWFLGVALIPSFLKLLFLSIDNKSYYADLGIDMIGPFHSRDEFDSWYNSNEDWKEVDKIDLTRR